MTYLRQTGAGEQSRHARRDRQRGTALSELAILLPLLILMVLVGVDFGRLVYDNQVLVDLTRETANMVSRGATSDQAFAAAQLEPGELDVIGKGGIIISKVQRHSSKDPTPWVISQDRRGAMGSSSSKVGKVNAVATIPGVTQLDAGITITAVEIMHPFKPVFTLKSLGLNLYPTTIYDVAYF
jgi:TadE-like protein